MKRLLTLLLMLVSLASATWADLTVGDVKVTATGNVSPSGLKSGTIYYDASTNTLTLNNATLAYEPSANSNEGVITTSKGTTLTITVKGTNSVTSSKTYAALKFYTSTITFNGDGSLDLAGRSDDLYGLNESTIIIKGSVRLTAMKNGIGTNNYCKKLTVAENAVVKAKQISYVRELELLNGQEIVEPAGATFENNAVRVNGSLAKNVVIMKLETYPIKVLGKSISNLNASNFTVDGLTSGTVKYDAASNTLTLSGVTMTSTADDVYGLWTGSAVGSLTVKLVGTNTINTKNMAIGVNSNLTFTGTGNLTATSTGSYGISCMGSSKKVTIENSSYCVINSKNYAVYGNQSELVLKKAKSDDYGYRFTNTSGGAAIYNLTALTLDNTDFFYQESLDISGTPGCYFDAAAYTVKQNGGALASKVAFKSIKEALPIYVCGKQLNVVSSYDIIEAGSPSITGGGGNAVCYDPSTKTLTLNNATIDNTGAPGDPAYCLKFDDFQGTVQLVGDNKVVSIRHCAIQTVNDKSEVTFKGSGSLTAKGPNYGLMPWAGKIILSDNVKVTAEGSSYGIGSNNAGKYNETVVISGNAQVKANTIGGLHALTLEGGQQIVAPAGAVFKLISGDTNHGVCESESSNTLAKNVVIQKVETYPIEVCDMAVNSYNAADILGDGTFKYDNSTKTLTINGATIDNTSLTNVVLNENVEDLKINIVGTNNLKVNSQLFELKAKTTFTGTGTVNGEVTDWQSIGIFLNKNANYQVIADGPTFNIKGARGVTGFQAPTFVMNSGKFVFEPSGTNENIFNAISNSAFTLGDGMAIVEPEGGYYDSSLRSITVDGTERYRGKVVIQKAQSYGLMVSGIPVTSLNCADILGDGKAVYDAEANVLTLDGATLTGIENRVADLKVIVKGETTVENNADNAVLIDSYSNITFEGDGTLTLRSTNKTSLGMRLAATFSGAGSVLTMLIQGPKVNITAGQGLYGTGFDPILDIYYPSTLSYAPVEGGNANPISGFLGFNLSKLTMVSPAGAYYNTSNRYVQLNDARYTGALLIDIEAYDLWIAGTRVTEVNKDDILGNGVFSYVSWYKTLKISGDYDHTTETRLVDSKIEDLIINVERPSRLTTTFDPTIIHLSANTEIRGGRLILECTSEDQDCIGIYQDGGDKLTISNADIEVGDGFSYAITGEPGIALEVISSDISAKAHAEGCFKDFESMTLTDCYIESHRGATYTDGALVDADGHIIGSDAMPETVVIKRGTDAVNGLAAGTAATDVFDVAGRKLDTVGRGINIVRSADGRVRKVLKK